MLIDIVYKILVHEKALSFITSTTLEGELTFCEKCTGKYAYDKKIIFLIDYFICLAFFIFSEIYNILKNVKKYAFAIVKAGIKEKINKYKKYAILAFCKIINRKLNCGLYSFSLLNVSLQIDMFSFWSKKRKKKLAYLAQNKKIVKKELL